MTSKEYADALLDEWQHGTDLKDQLSRDVWKDYDEKAVAAFRQCKKDQLEEIIAMVKDRVEEPQFVQALMIKLLTMKQEA